MMMMKLWMVKYLVNQPENDDVDVCHPIDDCRSPVSDNEEMGIGVNINFVNNYFGVENNFDFLHPQQYKKADEPIIEGNTAIMEIDPKGKAVVLDEGSEGEEGSSSSSCDRSESENEHTICLFLEDVNDDGHHTYWYNQYEKVWGCISRCTRKRRFV
ncbi:hypothetical protein MKX01_012399 [Papaver californicum]|nr:hypothetical protein MKX01_012399 [Papaver californicum]